MAQAGPSRGRSDEFPYPHSDSTWGSNSNSDSYTHTQSHSSFINCEVVASHREATVRIVKDLPRPGYETPKAPDSQPNTPNRRRNTFYSTFSTDSPRQQATPDFEEPQRGRSLSPPPAERRNSRYSSYSYDQSRSRQYDSEYSRRDYERRDRDYDRSYADDYDGRSEMDDLRAPEDQYVRPPKDKRRNKKKKEKEMFSNHISKIVDGVIRGKWKDPYGYDEDDDAIGAGPDSYKDVVSTRWSIVGTLIFLYYCAACVFYFTYRAKYTLNMGITWYGWIVLSIEMFTATSSLAYAYLLCRNTRTKSTDGLAPARRNKFGQYEPVVDERLKFHVRVLIPCYKETMELVQKTVMCALEAELPDNTRRTVYLCDDGNDSTKRDMIEELAAAGLDVAYVTGRERLKGEINGKSNNLNNTLVNHIYKDVEDHTIIPPSECLVIFDADMCANPNFFIKILEVMYDENVSLCLTPQAFHNINLAADIFNNSNLSFWEYILPGCDAVGYIACTGTNFCIRANALCECGWFPTYTITEDYALGMELKKRDRKAVYLNEYIAIGEAPEEIRNIFRQRSRWCKGQMQVLFSKACPMFDTGLPFSMRLLYTSVTWCYVTNILAVPLGVLVPFVAIVIGYYPLTINFQFAIASTLFYFANNFVVMFCSSSKHIKPMWFCSVSCHLLWFTYTKAFINVLIAKTGFKSTVFKATKKVGEDDKAKKRNCCTPGNMGDLEGTKDAYVLFFSFFLSFLTFASGVYQILDNPNTAQGDFRFYLLLSVFWATFNMIPPALFIFYVYNKGRVFEEFCSFCLVACFALALGAVSCLWLVPNDYDFGQVLGLALQFYEIQHSGKVQDSANRHIWWREDAFVNQTFTPDKGGYATSITAGFFDNYGFVKYTYTTAVSTAFLAWSMLEFSDGYTSSNNRDYVASHINWGATYLQQCIIRPKNSNSTVVQAVLAQVGSVAKDQDSAAWTRPEDYSKTKPTPKAYFVDKSNPGADVAAATAAGLAAAAIVLNGGFAAKASAMYQDATDVYKFAAGNPGLYTVNGKVDTGYMYLSFTYRDDLAWAAIWLYKACMVFEKPRYKGKLKDLQNFCFPYYKEAYGQYSNWVSTEIDPAQPYKSANNLYSATVALKQPPYHTLNPFVFNYENVGYGAAMLLYRGAVQQNLKAPAKDLKKHLDVFMDVWLGKTLKTTEPKTQTPKYVLKWVSYTKRGMAYQNPMGNENYDARVAPHQGGLGNTMNAAFLALLYAKFGLVTGSVNMQVKCWARGQVGYILGDGGRSYLVGYKPNYPERTPHKAASCMGLPQKSKDAPDQNECTYESAYDSVLPNPHTLYGALVGGPHRDESFTDERTMDIAGNPFVAATLLNNAGFTATLAGLKHWNINLAKCEQGHGLIQNIRRKIKGTNDGEIWGSW